MIAPPGARLSRVDPASCEVHDLAAAAAWLASGGIVVFPTETFYGLAVNPRSEAAVAAIFALKGRDQAVQLPLVAASREAVERVLGALDEGSRRLADRFWPGPLSLVVPATTSVARGVHNGTGTVAVRVPSHPVARRLAEAAGGLVTATSANRHGEPPAARVESLDGLAADPRVFVVDGGPTPGGLPSTIVDARTKPPVLVRPGAVKWEDVLAST